MKYDYRIYDEKPGEEYIQGYAITVYVRHGQAQYKNMRNIIENPKINALAYIPTEYGIDERAEVAYGICFLVFATDFEWRIGKYVLKQFSMLFELPPVNPVWFHKGWVRDIYDPTMYDTDAKKYRKIMIDKGMGTGRNGKTLREEFTKKELARLRKHYCMQTYKCYEPINGRTHTCKNSVLRDPKKNCKRCPLSHAADRYDSHGRCIKKLRDMK